MKRALWLPAVLALPACVVALVGAYWWAARSAQDLLAAQVYAGAPHPDWLSVRAVLLRVSGNRVAAAHGCVVLRLGQLQLPGCSNGEGVVDFNQPLTPPLPQHDAVWTLHAEHDAQHVLARGTWAELRSPSPRVETRGGWITGHAQGEIAFEVGIEQGVLAVPFPARVLLTASRAQQPVPGLRVLAELTGAAPQHSVLTTNAHGQALLGLQPEQHVVELRLQAEQLDAESSVRGSWYATLPVVPGAMWASLRDRELYVASPIGREHAYVNLVTAQGVLRQLSLKLQARGTQSEAQLPVPELGAAAPLTPGAQDSELYAVVSSEPDMQAMASVGWPLGSGVRAAALARPVRVSDGVAQAQARAAEQRTRRLRWLAAGVLSLALLEVALLWRALRQAAPGEWLHPVSEVTPGAAANVVRRPGFALIAVLLSIACGLLALTALLL